MLLFEHVIVTERALNMMLQQKGAAHSQVVSHQVGGDPGCAGCSGRSGPDPGPLDGATGLSLVRLRIVLKSLSHFLFHF